MKNKIFSLSMDGKVQELENELKNDTQGINDKADLDYSPLAIAVARGHKDVVKLLLANGAVANTQDQKGNTPLHYASENNSMEIAELLLAHGADLNIQNNSGNQALWTATFSAADGDQNKIPLVKLLLQNGADKQHLNNVGKKPVDIANKIGVPALIELLA
ncbi:ankyrin repeat domain-containing protein [Pedobacter alluvionis]|nr:ankyrin repeat domain-containing protein [Pedobacter alluvionis]